MRKSRGELESPLTLQEHVLDGGCIKICFNILLNIVLHVLEVPLIPHIVCLLVRSQTPTCVNIPLNSVLYVLEGLLGPVALLRERLVALTELGLTIMQLGLVARLELRLAAMLWLELRMSMFVLVEGRSGDVGCPPGLRAGVKVGLRRRHVGPLGPVRVEAFCHGSASE